MLIVRRCVAMRRNNREEHRIFSWFEVKQMDRVGRERKQEKIRGGVKQTRRKTKTWRKHFKEVAPFKEGGQTNKDKLMRGPPGETTQVKQDLGGAGKLTAGNLTRSRAFAF